jgi:hypothetical protein
MYTTRARSILKDLINYQKMYITQLTKMDIRLPTWQEEVYAEDLLSNGGLAMADGSNTQATLISANELIIMLRYRRAVACDDFIWREEPLEEFHRLLYILNDEDSKVEAIDLFLSFYGQRFEEKHLEQIIHDLKENG